MDLHLKQLFQEKWERYFGSTELPIVFFYSKELHNANYVVHPKGRSCVICELMKVRKGTSLAYDSESIACGGGKKFLGYTDTVRPDFEYFLSCGIPGKMEGERYKKTPEIVLETLKYQKTVTEAKGNFIIFKRWDMLEEVDNPEVVIFFAKPDVLSGLFTLANFDQIEPNGVFAPFGAGCSTIVHYPYIERNAERPRAVLGMFYPSARPCVQENILSLAIPMIKFRQMVEYMDESFLSTNTWQSLKKRIDS